MTKEGKISFWAAVLMNMNIMIGVGIYFLPQMMAKTAGNFSFLGWVLSSILVFPVIWNVALASRMFPGEGGFFRYCKSGLGETVGFVAIWTYLLGFISVIATQVVVLRKLLQR